MNRFARILRGMASLLLLGLFLMTLAGLITYYQLVPELPDNEEIQNVELQVPLRIFSQDGKLLAEFGEKRRVPLTYAEIPEQVRQAFLAAEDDRFFEHPGVDYQGLLRAAAQLAATGERKQGGSTITMQLARNFFLSREKTFNRKIKEILLSFQIEHLLSKEAILTLYLNKIYLGHHAYGVAAAAYRYFGKSLRELSLGEIALLAGLPKAPSTLNPIANPEGSVQRRNYVLSRMRDLGYIDVATFKAAKQESLVASLHQSATELEAPYVAEMARLEMVERFGEAAYEKGLNAYTTLDGRLQNVAVQSVRHNLEDYDRRHGYRGPLAQWPDAATQETAKLLQELGRLSTAGELVTAVVRKIEDKSATLLLANGATVALEWRGMEWARKFKQRDLLADKPHKARDILKVGDVIQVTEVHPKPAAGQNAAAVAPYWRLTQLPEAQAALLAMRPQDGAILALVGGYDFALSHFNRATQANRQPGSGFKPFIYSAALDSGYTTASIINDAPLVIEDGSAGAWRPQNFNHTFSGPTRMRDALTHSRNLVSIRILRAIGIPTALQHAANFGFDPKLLNSNLSLALGSGEVTVMQMARAYSVFANGGFLINPYLLDHIDPQHGERIFTAAPAVVCATDCLIERQAHPNLQPAPRTLSTANHFLMTSMLKDVIQRGTARPAAKLNRVGMAGKTGTTNDQRDAWFNGFVPGLVAISWVGMDSYEPLGRQEVGGKAALPAWISFMESALAGVPDQDWPMPETVVRMRIAPGTGQLAEAGTENAIYEYFEQSRLPTPQTTDAPEQHFKSSELQGVTEELF